MTVVEDRAGIEPGESGESPKGRGWQLEFAIGAAGSDPTRWLDLQRHAGIARPAKAQLETHIHATPHAVRCQWVIPRPGEPDLVLLVRPGQRAVLLDRADKRFVELDAGREPDPWSAERTGRARASAFGRAEEYRLLPPSGQDGSHLSLWLLPGLEVGQWLAPLWRIALPPLSATGLPVGVPLELRFEKIGDGEPDAVMRLNRLQRASFDARSFAPGRDDRPGFDAAVSAAPATTLAAAGTAESVGVARGQGRPPAIVFQSQTMQEKAKLFVHSSVIDTVARTAGFVSSLLEGVTGTGLSLNLACIYDQVARNAPDPGGVAAPDRLAPNIVNRILLGLLYAKLDMLLEPMELRQAVNDAVTAAETPGGDVLGVALPANVDPQGDSAAAFDLMKRYIVDLAGAIGGDVDPLAQFKSLWAGGSPERHTAVVRILGLTEMTPSLQRAMKSWFDVNLGTVVLEPDPPLQQSNGRNEGWVNAKYVKDAVAELVDLELEIGSSEIDFGRQPLVDPPVAVTPTTDTLLATLDFLDSVQGRPRTRIGFRTVVRVKRFSVGATASTNPTTRSPFVVELALVCPPCIPLLWQSAAGTVTLDDITVGVVLAIANDPLGAEDPRLELHVGTPVAAATDFSAIIFGGLATYPLLSTAANSLANIIGNAILPGLLASLTKPLAAKLRIPEDTFARLQPLLSLDRESYRRRLRAVINGAPDDFLDVATAQRRLDELVNHTPSGQNTTAFRSEFIAYGLSLAIAEPGPGGPLVYPADREARLPGDMTLLLSHATLQYFLAWAGYGVGYQGDIRLAETPEPELPDKPVVDFWNDAPEPERLGEKPNYRTGPPQVTMLPGASLPDWLGYFGIARVSNGICRILPVSNPAPNEPIAELCVTVELDVGVITFTPITYEVCEDLTRLAEWLDEGFGPPITPIDPGDPVPPWADGLVSVRRTGPTQLDAVGPAISSAVLDALAKAVDDPRQPGGPRLPAGVIASPARGIAGLQADIGRFGHTVACSVVTSWDKKGMENWLQARLTVTVPVLFGMGNTFLADLRFLPPLSFRIDPSQPVIGELVASAPEGPLAGLLQGNNREWLRTIMANHAISLLRSGRAAYRIGQPPQGSGLNYAYGPVLSLLPEGFRARVFMTLHPSHWTADPDASPPDENDVPPFITVETFGSDPDRLNLAVNFHLRSNLFDRIVTG
jgi:hypothetical protein